MEQNKQQNDKLTDLSEYLNTEKNDLSKLKKKREKLWKTNQKLKQQTGIVNKKSLKADFDLREHEIRLQEDRILAMKEFHQQLTKVIERANQVQMSKMTN